MMKTFFFFKNLMFVSFVFSDIAFAKVLFDKPSDSECKFYLHLEEQLLCAKKGREGSEYFTVYGYKYCNRFSVAAKENNWSTDQVTWVKKTTYCLQEELVKLGENIMPCSHLDEKAFDAHPHCYYINGICRLKLKEELDIIGVAWNFDIIEKGKQSTVQFYRVLESCVNDWKIDMFSLLARVFSQSGFFSATERKKAIEIMSDLPKNERNLAKYFELALARNLFGGTEINQKMAAKAYAKMYSKTALLTDREKMRSQSECLMGSNERGCETFTEGLAKETKSVVEFLKKNGRREFNGSDLDEIIAIKKSIVKEEHERSQSN